MKHVGTDTRAATSTGARSMRSFGRFCLVSGLAFAGYVALVVLLHEWMGLMEELAVALAMVASFVASFIVSRLYVFDARAGNPARQLLWFAVAHAALRVGQYVSFLLLHTWLGVQYVIAVVAISGVWVLIKFAVYQRFVFTTPTSPSRPTEEAGWTTVAPDAVHGQVPGP